MNDVVLVNENESATPPTVPQTVGERQFIGWDTSAYTFVTADVLVTALYASTYPEAEYVLVSFVYIDESGNEIAIQEEPQRVVKGQSAVAPEAPSREGMKFIGWDKTFTVVNEDTKVTAQYESLASFTVTINYVNASGTNIASPYSATISASGFEPFTVNSPAVEGLAPDKLQVEIT